MSSSSESPLVEHDHNEEHKEDIDSTIEEADVDDQEIGDEVSADVAKIKKTAETLLK
jgi:hypothetical protein